MSDTAWAAGGRDEAYTRVCQAVTEAGPQREQETNAYFFDMARMARNVLQRFRDLQERRRRRQVNRAPAAPPPEPGSPRTPRDPELAQALARLGAKVGGASSE